MRTTEERFWEKVQKGSLPQDCWEWIGAASTVKGINGMVWRYGHFNIGGSKGRTVAAHRFSYELHHGQPIPKGLVIDHLCRNTRCVNPTHLRVCTQRDNVLAPHSQSHFRLNVLKTECPKGHPYSPENTYVHRGSRRCKRCNRDLVNKLGYEARRARRYLKSIGVDMKVSDSMA